MVSKPSHYIKGGMECIDFIRAIVSDLTPYEAYCLGNVVKYLWRFKDKNGVIDLDKAVRYIEFLKEAQGNDSKRSNQAPSEATGVASTKRSCS